MSIGALSYLCEAAAWQLAAPVPWCCGSRCGILWELLCLQKHLATNTRLINHHCNELIGLAAFAYNLLRLLVGSPFAPPLLAVWAQQQSKHSSAKRQSLD
jgi:hypothetical protein